LRPRPGTKPRATCLNEKGRFRHEAVSRIGKKRAIGTGDLKIRAIRTGLVTIDEADADKVLIAGKSFMMRFGSFHEVVPWPR
jgi:hypothetical protein